MERNVLTGPQSPVSQGSIGNLLYHSLAKGGSNIAMIDAETGREATYEEILQSSINVAQNLKHLGLTSNDTITVCGANSLYFTISSVAALYLGIRLAPVNHLYTPRELVHAMNISKPKVVFCSSAVLGNIMKASKDVKSVESIIVLDKYTNLPKSVHSLEDYLYFHGSDEFTVTPVDNEHVAAVMCSSGTTGIAKGVQLTHGNLNAAHSVLIHPEFADFNASCTVMALLPFYHAYGFVSHLSLLITNMTMVVLSRFEDRTFLNAIQRYKITKLFLVPPVIVFLGKHPLVDRYDLSSLQEIICGAAPLGKEMQQITTKRLNLKNIRQGYGLTEATLGVTMTPRNSDKYGSVGVVAPNMQMKIRDVNTNRTLGPNEEGELCLRGPMVMKGYADNPKATVDTMDTEGWLFTGDAGYYDTEGYVYIVDRYKELIKYKGFQVPPAEIEAILLKHPQIKECGVIGKPDTVAGEVPVAFVVRQLNATITEKEVIAFVAENVSYHKQLHGGVRFVSEIPKSPTGKILRRILREQLKMSSKL